MDLVHSEAVQNKALTQSTILFYNSSILMMNNITIEQETHLFFFKIPLFVSFSLPKKQLMQ